MLNFITPIPVIATTLMTLSGLLLHDMHIDKATYVAIATPAMAASASTVEKTVISQNYHTHSERVSVGGSFRGTLPNLQPPRDDHRHYLQNKKLMYMGGGDAVGLWPSV